MDKNILQDLFGTLSEFKSKLSDDDNLNDIVVGTILRKISNGTLDSSLFIPLEEKQEGLRTFNDPTGKPNSKNRII
jgi:hypothetical protein